MGMIKVFTEYLNSAMSKIADEGDSILIKKKNYFYLRYLGIAVAASKDINKEQFKKTNLMIYIQELWDNEILNESSYRFFEKHRECIVLDLNELYKNTISGVDISLLYQGLLNLSINFNTMIVEENIAQKKNTGAYYTSKEFAKIITRKAIDDYIYAKTSIQKFSYFSHTNQEYSIVMKELLNTSIGDLSCGGGEFLLAYFEYIYLYLPINQEFVAKITSKVYGVDIDPVALLITQIKICSITNIYVSKNYILGNPLLKETSLYNFDEKVECSALGSPYISSLGVNIESNKLDIILGNPPWEKIRFEDKYFFKAFDKDISMQSKKNDRMKLIECLSIENKEIYEEYLTVKNDYEIAKKQIKNNKMFEYSSKGELNTYNLFVELTLNILAKGGIAAIIVKSGVVTTPANKKLFNYLVDECFIDSIYSFKNSKKIFDIDSREKFCVLFLGQMKKDFFNLHVGLQCPEQINSCKSIQINKKLLKIMNPLTLMLPNIENQTELDFIVKLHSKLRIFGDVYTDVTFARIVHLTSHADKIQKISSDKFSSIYEGKFIGQYNGRFATFCQMSETEMYKNKASAKKIQGHNPSIPVSRFFIETKFWERISVKLKEKYSLLWRSLTSSTNSRTMIATILPKTPTCQSIQLLQVPLVDDLLMILALFNSMTFDYIVRLKLSNIDLTQTVVLQMPIPERHDYEKPVVGFDLSKSAKEIIMSRLKIIYANESRLVDVFGVCEKATECEIKRAITDIDEIIRRLYGISDEYYRQIVCSFN